jgi:hypothetical protein
MLNKRLNVFSFKYKILYIIENRNYWHLVKDEIDIKHDLVLTIDFAVKKDVEKIGGSVEFLDHLADPIYLNEMNYKLHHFIDNWFIADGEDVFKYREINFGNSFKLNILNDITYPFHFLTSFLCIRDLKYEKIICGADDIWIKQILNETQNNVEFLPLTHDLGLPTYYFPVARWMKTAITRKPLKQIALTYFLLLRKMSVSILNRLKSKNRKYIYVNVYFPTYEIVRCLKKDKSIELVLNNYTSLRNSLSENRINFRVKNTHKYLDRYTNIFLSIKRISFHVSDMDFGPLLFKIIEPIVLENISRCLNSIDSIISYFEGKDLRLMIPITELWLENRLVINYCLKKNIPVYMIINGLLTNNSFKDGFDSTWVNSFGVVIKEDYYLNANNIKILGDPRMDFYANCEKKIINPLNPTIVIGTSGYNPVDLNSYLAIEFDFIFDVLEVLRKNINSKKINILIKVRTNGYLEKYNEFIKEYFGEMEIHVVQNVPFINVIKKADLYISIYSQTLFEAACLGIPSIYYKKDTEVNSRPFDCKSELVTAENITELENSVNSFFEKSEIFTNFMKKETLEKYVGFLDGNNCKRNLEFIYSLLE